MTGNEAIAAIIAADTPLKAARYAIDNPPGRDIQALLDWIVEATDTIHALREQLAAAQARAAKAEDALTEILNAGEWTWSEADDTTVFTIHLPGSVYDAFYRLLTKEGE